MSEPSSSGVTASSAAEPSSPLEQTISLLGSRIGGLIGPSESELTKWKRVFDAFAAPVEGSEQKFLTKDSFISAIAPREASSTSKIRREQYGVLFQVADLQKRGRISWEEFVCFESLLKLPDADYQIAFHYFDQDGNGTITFDNFKSVFSSAIGPDAIPFNFDSDWVRLYIGKRNVIGYAEFSQLMKGLQGERLRQAFRYFDTDRSGYISPEQFKRIIIEIARHKLSDSVLDRLPTLCLLSPGQSISYAEAKAFHNVLRDMTLIERLIQDAVAHSKDGKIDVNDLLNHSAAESRYTNISPLEANLVWHFASRGRGAQTRLDLEDFRALLDESWEPPQAMEDAHTTGGSAASTTAAFAEKLYAFVQGGIGGGAGAFVVYPIDMVKTRLQNQRSTVVGEVLYKNWWDCVKKIFRNEGGVPGFYKGLLPQMIGVAPEKAIKLTVNDLVRRRFTDPETGRIKLWQELLAGGAAGACQVCVTNPLEITKIRLQMQGELAKDGVQVARGVIPIIRSLGLVGLYKGAGACLLRDAPFSLIYFTSYAHLKKDLFGEGKNGKQLSNLETLLAAGMGGMPAAYLTTPADVVKTRLQTEARAGQTHYKGMIDAFVVITQEEGAKALFKGGVARVIRSSPQFAVTLAVYEFLKKTFPFPYGDKAKPVPGFSSPLAGGFLGGNRSDYDITRVRARNALKILLDVHEDFGRTTIRPQGGKSVFAAKPRPAPLA